MRQRQWRQTSVLYFRPPSTKAWYQLLPLQAELTEVGQVKHLVEQVAHRVFAVLLHAAAVPAFTRLRTP